MAAEFSWTPPLVVLALGAVAGAVVVSLRSHRKPGPDVGVTGRRVSETSDLQRRYDAVIRRLSEGVSPEEKNAVELEAARILMEMESADQKRPVSPVAERERAKTRPDAPRAASAITGFVYGVLAMATLGGLFYLASQGSAERPQGGSLTGGNTMGSSAASAEPPTDAAAEAALKALEESVRRTPTDVAQRVELTRAYLQRRDLMKVFDQTQAILEIEPGQPHALTYQALVRVAMGQADQAETMLVDAIGKNPGIEDAYIHLAIARLQLGNRQGAEAAIQAGQKQFPEDRELLANVLEQITSAALKEGGAAPPVDDHDRPEAPASPAATSPSAGAGSVVVVVDLPRGMTVAPGAVLFVMAREAGFDSGPPAAVKRVPAVNFPITVTLSEKDSMAGESLPGLLRIDARIDRDGDPLSKDPRDPLGSEDNVRLGSGQVLLVLAPVK